MGRNKIKIKKIESDRIRSITYFKRKRGLLKKAVELSILCESEVLLIVGDKTQSKCLVYASNGNAEKMIENYVYKNEINKEVYDNSSYSLRFYCGLPKELSQEKKEISYLKRKQTFSVKKKVFFYLRRKIKK